MATIIFASIAAVLFISEVIEVALIFKSKKFRARLSALIARINMRG